MKTKGEYMNMTLRKARRKYPDCFLVLTPLMRDARSNWPVSFRVLTTCPTEDEADKAREDYAADGVESVFLVPNYYPMVREMSVSNTSRMFRVLYGME